MAVVKVCEIELYYEVHGSGDPMVLIMGYGAHSGGWFAIRDKLAKEYRLIIFDNRGTGRSQKPDIPYTPQMMAEDVVGLLDINGIKRAHVLGVSMGGMIAQEFALTYPNRLKTLILGCTSCGGKEAIQPTPEAAAFLMAIAKLPPEEKYQQMIPWALSDIFAYKNPEIVKRFVSISLENPTPLHAGVAQMNIAITFNSYDRLPQIKAPTLIISGAKDRLMPPENSKTLASRIPGSEVVIIENGGHAFYIDSSDEAASVILQFLRKHSKKG